RRIHVRTQDGDSASPDCRSGGDARSGAQCHRDPAGPRQGLAGALCRPAAALARAGPRLGDRGPEPMKVLMFRHHDERRIGVAPGDPAEQVLALAARARATGATSFPADLLGLIEAGDAGLGLVRELLALPPSTVSPHVRKLAGLELLAPLDPPRGDVLAIGRNYGKHASESAQAWGEEVKPPTVFSKAQTSVTGPFDDIVIGLRISAQIDWEVELGVGVGRTPPN